MIPRRCSRMPLEGWGEAAGEREFDKVLEILDGPLVPPQVAKRQVA